MPTQLKSLKTSDKALKRVLPSAPSPTSPTMTESRKRVNSQLQNALYNATTNDEVHVVLSILEDPSVDVNWRNPEDNNRTALHVAADHGHSVIAALLIGKGGRVYQQDNDGQTPLHAAMKFGDEKCVALLVDKAVSSLDETERLIDIHERIQEEAQKQLEQGVIRRIKKHVEAVVAESEIDISASPAKSGVAGAPTDPSIKEGELYLFSEGLRLRSSSRAAAWGEAKGSRNFMREWRFDALQHSPRESLITEMLQLSHFRTVYNIFVAVLIVAGLNVLCQNYIDEGYIVDPSFFVWVFGGFWKASLYWLTIFGMSVSIYFFQKGYVRGLYHRKLLELPVALVITFQLISAPAFSHVYRLPPASGLFVMCEALRLAMKVHSYVNVNQALERAALLDKEENRKPNTLYPSNVTFSNYMYFLFAPTLVYQAVYPKTPSIKWQAVAANAAEHLGCIGYVYAIFSRYCVPHFRAVAEAEDWATIIRYTFHFMMPAFLVFLLCFYGMIHAWLNCFAHLTRFADKQFYLDWWNATNWGGYFHKWSLVFHKWLYRHAYLEFVHSLRWSTSTASRVTVIMSSLVPEYILCGALRIYFPPMFLMMSSLHSVSTYAVGLLGTSHRVQNIGLWVMMFVGNAMMMTFYARAWFQQNADEASH